MSLKRRLKPANFTCTCMISFDAFVFLIDSLLFQLQLIDSLLFQLQVLIGVPCDVLRGTKPSCHGDVDDVCRFVTSMHVTCNDGRIEYRVTGRT